MSANTTGASSVGSTLYVVATAPATYDAAGYAALTWVAVGEIRDIPEFGKRRNSISFVPLNGNVQKYGGVTDNGKINIPFLLNTDDAGQIILKSGQSSNAPISVRVTTQNGDVYYFRALVLSFLVNIGDANSMTMGSCELDITTTSAGVGIVESLAA